MRRWLEHLHRRPHELSPMDAYARWAPVYPPKPSTPLMALEQPVLLAMLPEIKDCRALDLGCGSGRYLKELLSRGASFAVGLDLSWPMTSCAHAISPCLNQGDLRSLPLADASFDLVVCALAIGHVEELQPAMTEIARVLMPGGVVIYSDFHPIGSFLGWKRSFKARDGAQYSVRHHTHFYTDHHAACRSAVLTIEDVREPRITFPHRWQGCPAVIIIRARKTAPNGVDRP